jgi:hypothetical protein
MCRILSLVLCFCYGSYCFGQNKMVIDQQVLTNGKLIRLISNSSADENKRYSIEFINRLTNDTIVNFIDSVQHAHCSDPNSIFFTNDSTGFFTESGGCYASYNWLFRTNDRGLTWSHIKSGSRTDGNAFRMLNNESFFMFNESIGIIVWQINDGKLIYSLTNDGGINWTMHSQLKFAKNNLIEFQNIGFSNDGQVIIVCCEKYIFESDRKKVFILESNDFGKSFHKLN